MSANPTTPTPASSKKRKGLGLGLETLLGVQGADITSAGHPSSLPLDALVAGRYQPRTRMDEGALYELAESIKAQGVMQPILVRPLGEGRFEIIAGERRTRAARLAGLDMVPVLVREVPDQAALAMALIENIQREDLNPLEEAQGIQRLIAEFSFTHEQAAQAVGRSRTAGGSSSRRSRLDTAARERPTASAASACVSENSLIGAAATALLPAD